MEQHQENSKESVIGGLKRKAVQVTICNRHLACTCLFLDNKSRPLAYEKGFYAINHRAKKLLLETEAVILAHSHSFGSQLTLEDIEFSAELRGRIFDDLDITVLDHLVVGDNGITSFAKLGIFAN